MNSAQAIAYIIQRLEAELPDSLLYHSSDHTKEVMEASRRIAREEGIAGQELELLMTAVAYHDSGFLVAYEDHEKNSCKIAEENLPRFGYFEDQIQIVTDLIMSTKVPQNARTKLGRILCDADLDYLGGDDYDEVSQQLYDEMSLNGKKLSDEDWLKLQISFLQGHHYWTKFGREHRADRKEERLRELKQELEGLSQ